jgi:hypothetical protein
VNPWWHQPLLWIHLDNLFRQVHFEDDSDNNIVELGLDEVQPLEPERFQVGDQVMGFFEPEGTFYPCEIVEVRELTYVVHFFDSPETELYELDESQVLDQISLAEIVWRKCLNRAFLFEKVIIFCSRVNCSYSWILNS